MNLWIFAKISGSLLFTHASFDAVKLPGELRVCSRQNSRPIPSRASAPIPTARESHQMIDLRSGSPSSESATSPCIW